MNKADLEFDILKKKEKHIKINIKDIIILEFKRMDSEFILVIFEITDNQT